MAAKLRPEQQGLAISVDPTLAAAYLDRIPIAVRTLAAARTDAAEARTVFAWASTGIVFGLVLWSGALRRVEGWLAARGVAPGLTALVVTAIFMLLLEAAELTIGFGAAALWPAGAGLAAQALPAALWQGVIGGVALMLLMTVLRSAPRWGWVGLSVLVAAAVFCAVLIPPLVMAPGVRGDTPISVAAASPILAFIHHGGLAADRLFAFDSADPLAVDMEGLGPFARAAVSRAALAAPRPETYAAIGHLLGHHAHKDLWSLALLWSGLAAAFLFAAAKALNAPWSSGAKALPLIGLIAWAGLGVATPVFNLFDQAINYRADDYALGLTRDPDALCRWLIATEAASKADPSPLESVIFYDHPPLGARLRNALRWTAGDH